MKKLAESAILAMALVVAGCLPPPAYAAPSTMVDVPYKLFCTLTESKLDFLIEQMGGSIERVLEGTNPAGYPVEVWKMGKDFVLTVDVLDVGMTCIVDGTNIEGIVGGIKA